MVFGLFSLTASARPNRKKRAVNVITSQDDDAPDGCFKCADYDVSKWSACSFDVTAFLRADDDDDRTGGREVKDMKNVLNESDPTLDTNRSFPTPPGTAAAIGKHNPMVIFDFDPDAIRQRKSNEMQEKNDDDDIEVELGLELNVNVNAEAVVEDIMDHEIIPQPRGPLTLKKGLKNLAKPNPNTEYIVLSYNRIRIEQHLDYFCPPTDREPTISKRTKRPNTQKTSNMSSSSKPWITEEKSSISHINQDFSTVIPIVRPKQQPKPKPVTLVPQSNTNIMVEQHQPNQHLQQNLYPKLIDIPTTFTDSQIYLETNVAFSLDTMSTIQEKIEENVFPTTADMGQHHEQQHEQGNLSSMEEASGLYQSDPSIKKQWRSIRSLADDMSEGIGTKESIDKVLKARQDQLSESIGAKESMDKVLKARQDQLSFFDDKDEIDYQENPDCFRHDTSNDRSNVVSPAFFDHGDKIDYRKNPGSFHHDTNSDKTKVVSPAFFEHGDETDYLKNPNRFRQNTNGDKGKVVSPSNKIGILHNGHTFSNWKLDKEDRQKVSNDLDYGNTSDISRLSMDQNQLTPPLQHIKYLSMEDDQDYDQDIFYAPKNFASVIEDRPSQTHHHQTDKIDDHDLSYEPTEFSNIFQDRPSYSGHHANDDPDKTTYTPKKAAIIKDNQLPQFVDGNRDATSITTSITLQESSSLTMHSLRAAETLSSSYSSIDNPKINVLKTRLGEIRSRIKVNLKDIRLRNDSLFSPSIPLAPEQEDDDNRGGVYGDLPNLLDNVHSSDDMTVNDADHRYPQTTTKLEKYKPPSPTGVDEFDCEVAVGVETAIQFKGSSFFTSEVVGGGETGGTLLLSDVGRSVSGASSIAVLLKSSHQYQNLRTGGDTDSAKIGNVKGGPCLDAANEYILQLKARLRQIEYRVQSGQLCSLATS